MLLALMIFVLFILSFFAFLKGVFWSSPNEKSFAIIRVFSVFFLTIAVAMILAPLASLLIIMICNFLTGTKTISQEQYLSCSVSFIGWAMASVAIMITFINKNEGVFNKSGEALDAIISKSTWSPEDMLVLQNNDDPTYRSMNTKQLEKELNTLLNHKNRFQKFQFFLKGMFSKDLRNCYLNTQNVKDFLNLRYSIELKKLEGTSDNRIKIEPLRNLIRVGRMIERKNSAEKMVYINSISYASLNTAIDGLRQSNADTNGKAPQNSDSNV